VKKKKEARPGSAKKKLVKIIEYGEKEKDDKIKPQKEKKLQKGGTICKGRRTKLSRSYGILSMQSGGKNRRKVGGDCGEREQTRMQGKFFTL